MERSGTCWWCECFDVGLGFEAGRGEPGSMCGFAAGHYERVTSTSCRTTTASSLDYLHGKVPPHTQLGRASPTRIRPRHYRSSPAPMLRPTIASRTHRDERAQLEVPFHRRRRPAHGHPSYASPLKDRMKCFAGKGTSSFRNGETALAVSRRSFSETWREQDGRREARRKRRRSGVVAASAKVPERGPASVRQ